MPEHLTALLTAVLRRAQSDIPEVAAAEPRIIVRLERQDAAHALRWVEALTRTRQTKTARTALSQYVQDLDALAAELEREAVAK